MCGIHAVISTSGYAPPPQGYVRRCLCNRGPDYVGTVRAEADASLVSLTLTSTVLSLRGDHVAAQPLVDPATGSVLCWNGEAWRIGGRDVEGSDTEVVMGLLLLSSANSSSVGQEKSVLDALRSIEGPFALIYFDKPGRRVYYCRDRLGRRSLLVNKNDGDTVVLSSVADAEQDGWVEVEADGCYTVCLDDLVISRHEWVDDASSVSGIGIFCEKMPDTTDDPPSLCEDSPSVGRLRDHLIESLRLRVAGIPQPPEGTEDSARLAVLFSGGLDCTVLARMAADLVPPGQSIDLVNVAFENPRIAGQKPGCSRDELFELCPDRITARRSMAELVRVCPDRLWRFVTVNVPYTETCSHRESIIRLMYPHNTEMDLSIANALYFAARGRGLASMPSSAPAGEPYCYTTTARVLLSGLGADELFGGYIRHKTAFSHKGYRGLLDEMRLDVGRLGKRNLGRDDRVMAHWGREVRFPFLDERLVRWAVESPVWEKCNFADAAAEDPDKRVLRLVAESLGLLGVSREKKRAIQFGARTAKMESGKVKGTTFITP
ncbi:Asparagine synthetase B (glutamine-hydrolyzing) [Geosmithia morbida]|uniref:Asparagine synthetase B (Glutamine-hydrolyzing) n=1 Tax=Geosmithia morbida TaxID=1094350 RepID=A0A9P5D1H3_9HYPO|nr:Asparagine synthetase B (glutamine-hydrolyzing) [Geosmithia morbida]KAF4123903.1 Asparagine synthetase B (glutamine-hydrolyzing) [Geosmithia morbida]